MNLFELQERLKDFSQDQLVREMQAPSGSAPQYLVLSELQRRQRMMMEEQAQMDQPQTTVAQDAIAAAGVPQGGLADMAQAMAPRTDMDMNTAVQPVQRMADGGVVRMQPGGLARNPQQDEVDALARRIADIAARLEESNRAAARRNRGLSEVSADVGSFTPAAMGAPRMGADAGPLSDIEPRVSAARTAPELASIRPTDRQPILDEAAPPSLSDLLDLAGLETMEVGPVQGPRRPPTSMPLIGDSGDLQIQMPDGSLISPLELGITPGELAGAGTADLTGLSGLPSYLDLPSQEDLDMLYAGDQAGLAGRQSELDEAIEADTANRFIAQTFENEAARDAVEKILNPIRLPPMQGPPEPSMLDRLRANPFVQQAASALAFPGLIPEEADAEEPLPIVPMTPDDETPRPAPRPDRATTPPGGPRTSGAGAGAGAVATATDDAFEQDKWLALAQAGLALMSSQQPTIGGAIGEAGLAGISALRTARGERDERVERAQARADRLAAAAAASAGRGAQYPYRQADDLLKLADAYEEISKTILAANSGFPPSRDDPRYRDYQINLLKAELIRDDVGAMARGSGMAQASEDEE